MVDLTYDKEKVFRKLCELEEKMLILLQRIKKAKIEVMKIQTLEDAERFTEENDLNDGFMDICQEHPWLY